MTKWQIRDATASDAKAVEKFFLTVDEFKDSTLQGDEESLWHWLFNKSREGRTTALIAENSEGKIIGHYGVKPMRYTVSSDAIEAGMICKLAIDSNFRKQALFMQLTMKLLRESKAKGFNFLQGLANRAGLLEFHLAFGFKDLGEVPVYAKPIRFNRLAKAVIGHRLQKLLSVFIKFGEIAYSALDQLSSTGSGGRKFTFLRETSFTDGSTFSKVLSTYHPAFADRSGSALDARFVNAAGREYQIFSIREKTVVIGYFVLRSMPMKQFSALAIVDICFDLQRRDVAKASLRFITSRARNLQVDLIAILANSKYIQRGLRRSLFIKTSEAFNYVVYERKPNIIQRFPKIDDWFITWHDHDHV